MGPGPIYDLCEAGPRVASRTNDQGTRWVLLCRKSKANAEGAQGYASDQFNDIAMVGHNPFTINPAVATHATQMAASGWGAANRTAGMNMYGCTSAVFDGTRYVAKPQITTNSPYEG